MNSKGMNFSMSEVKKNKKSVEESSEKTLNNEKNVKTKKANTSNTGKNSNSSMKKSKADNKTSKTNATNKTTVATKTRIKNSEKASEIKLDTDVDKLAKSKLNDNKKQNDTEKTTKKEPKTSNKKAEVNKSKSSKENGNNRIRSKTGINKKNESNDKKQEKSLNEKKVVNKKNNSKETNKNPYKKSDDKTDENKKKEKSKIGNQQIEDKEIDNKGIDIDESKYDTVSLKEIRDAIENKVNESQKQSLVKKILINIGIAITMILYLILIIMGSKNIETIVLEKDIKIISLSILAIGIFVLEMAYKKDNNEMAINSLEILVFGASSLCLVYVIKLHFDNLINIITYIGGIVASYFILKLMILAITNVRKYKKDNSDIKEIIKK